MFIIIIIIIIIISSWTFQVILALLSKTMVCIWERLTLYLIHWDVFLKI